MYNSKYSSYVTEEDSHDMNHSTKHKRANALLMNSASAHDLRCLQVEKEKQDPKSPRGALEACLTRCSISSSSSSSEDPPPNREAVENADAEARCKNHRASSNWGKFFKLWKHRSMKRLSSFPPLGGAPTISKPRKNADPHIDGMNLHDIYSFQSSLHSFSIADLQIATDNFNPENIIGRGGYAEVYQGILPEGKLIAVKRLTKGTPDEQTAEFLSELGIIAHVDHPNTAKFIGCCIDGGMHLVFRLSPLGSLGSLLHGYTGRYFAPEYFMHGIVDEKTDVFAFGVLLLELITGHPALDESQQSLVLWAKPLLEKREIKQLVVELLLGQESVAMTPREAKRKMMQRTYSEELLDSVEYNSTKNNTTDCMDIKRSYHKTIVKSLPKRRIKRGPNQIKTEISKVFYKFDVTYDHLDHLFQYQLKYSKNLGLYCTLPTASLTSKTLWEESEFRCSRKLQSNLSHVPVKVLALLEKQIIFPEDSDKSFWIAHDETLVVLFENLKVHFRVCRNNRLRADDTRPEQRTVPEAQTRKKHSEKKQEK
ncbi:unnamed protein product, partial [Thlaspi arvense]